jgi:hypothetical protein
VGYIKKRRRISRDYFKIMFKRLKMEYELFDGMMSAKRLQQQKKQEEVRRTINMPKRPPSVDVNVKSLEKSYERRSEP